MVLVQSTLERDYFRLKELAKASYFSAMFDEVITTEAYWRLLKKATNPKVYKAIGPIKREDDSLAVLDDEKANLMNSYFATRLYVRSYQMPYPRHDIL